MPVRLSHADFADGYHPPEGKFEGKTTTKATFSTPLQVGFIGDVIAVGEMPLQSLQQFVAI